jgi:2EXR family
MANTSHQSDQGPPHSSKALDSFTLFPKLPIELKLKIWQRGFPTGREVNFAARGTNNSPRAKEVTQIEDNSPLPVTLYINRESRQENLKHYSVVLRSGYIGASARVKKESPSSTTQRWMLLGLLRSQSRSTFQITGSHIYSPRPQNYFRILRFSRYGSGTGRRP